MSQQPHIPQQVLDVAKERIGSSYEEFRADAEKAGWIVRATRIDSENMLGTCDYRDNRINVSVDKGLISGVSGIG